MEKFVEEFFETFNYKRDCDDLSSMNAKIVEDRNDLLLLHYCCSWWKFVKNMLKIKVTAETIAPRTIEGIKYSSLKYCTLITRMHAGWYRGQGRTPSLRLIPPRHSEIPTTKLSYSASFFFYIEECVYAHPTRRCNGWGSVRLTPRVVTAGNTH